MRIFIFLVFTFSLWAKPISLGVDLFFNEGFYETLKDHRVALLTNHTGVDSKMRSTIDLVAKHLQLCALFSPEHGLKGHHYAFESVSHSDLNGIPIYSLHGDTRRPTKEMLKDIDVVIYDIQCTGVRPYTYPTTLFYMMEEAAKLGVKIVVLDRPNPINGTVVDGPMLEEARRSFIGYINVPYCHGMTIGELAQFFNEEYDIGCDLQVIAMKDWKREMTYRDTGLVWIPPSPNVPEPDTPLFCPLTGLLGELQLSNIGIGFTLPFKVVGAPWIQSQDFADKLNAQKLPGVYFQPFHFRPFYGLYKGVDCEGVLIHVTNPKIYRPLSTQFLILGLLKSLYPDEVLARMENRSKKNLFCLANGTDLVFDILQKEKYPAWKLMEIHKAERELFLEKRKKYLLY